MAHNSEESPAWSYDGTTDTLYVHLQPGIFDSERSTYTQPDPPIPTQTKELTDLFLVDYVDGETPKVWGAELLQASQNLSGFIRSIESKRNIFRLNPEWRFSTKLVTMPFDEIPPTNSLSTQQAVREYLVEKYTSGPPK